MQDNTNIKGGLFIALGMLLLAIADNYIRFVTETIGLWQFHLSRSLIAVPILILAFKIQGGKIFPQHFNLVFLRTLLMVFAMLIYFGCLAFFPISQVAAGLFTSPIFVIVFSILLLREKVYISRILAVLIGSFGTFLALGLNFYDFSFLTPCPTSGIIISGKKDELVPFESINELNKRLSAQKGIKVDFQSVTEANHFFAKAEKDLVKTLDKYIKKEKTLFS